MKFVVDKLPSDYHECDMCTNKFSDYPVCRDTERLELINDELCHTYQICKIYTDGSCDKLISLSDLL